MGFSDKINELAQTLKNSGLAASMDDALEKAKNIIHGSNKKQEDMNKKTFEAKKQYAKGATETEPAEDMDFEKGEIRDTDGPVGDEEIEGPEEIEGIERTEKSDENIAFPKTSKLELDDGDEVTAPSEDGEKTLNELMAEGVMDEHPLQEPGEIPEDSLELKPDLDISSIDTSDVESDTDTVAESADESSFDSEVESSVESSEDYGAESSFESPVETGVQGAPAEEHESKEELIHRVDEIKEDIEEEKGKEHPDLEKLQEEVAELEKDISEQLSDDNGDEFIQPTIDENVSDSSEEIEPAEEKDEHGLVDGATTDVELDELDEEYREGKVVNEPDPESIQHEVDLKRDDNNDFVENEHEESSELGKSGDYGRNGELSEQAKSLGNSKEVKLERNQQDGPEFDSDIQRTEIPSEATSSSEDISDSVLDSAKEEKLDSKSKEESAEENEGDAKLSDF